MSIGNHHLLSETQWIVTVLLFASYIFGPWPWYYNSRRVFKIRHQAHVDVYPSLVGAHFMANRFCMALYPRMAVFPAFPDLTEDMGGNSTSINPTGCFLSASVLCVHEPLTSMTFYPDLGSQRSCTKAGMLPVQDAISPIVPTSN